MLGAYNSLANGEKGSFRNEQKPQGRHAKTPTDRGTSKQLKAIHKGGSPNRIIATVCWPCWGLEKKGKKKKKFATVSCTPESEEPPPNHRTRSSWAALALARGEAALSEPTSSPGRCPSMAAAVAAGLCLRCTVRGQVELSPSESNRLRPVPVIARAPLLLLIEHHLLLQLTTGRDKRGYCVSWWWLVM